MLADYPRPPPRLRLLRMVERRWQRRAGFWSDFGCLAQLNGRVPRCAPNRLPSSSSYCSHPIWSLVGASAHCYSFGLQSQVVWQQRDGTLHCGEFVDEATFEHVERCASTHSLTPRCRAPAPPAMPAPTASLTTWQADGAGDPLIQGASTGVPVTSITLVAVGFVSLWPRPSGLDNPALLAASASFPVSFFSLEPPPCPRPCTHSGLTLGSSGLAGTSEHLEHRADGGGPTPTCTAATAVTVAAISGLSAARRAVSSEVRRTCEKSNPHAHLASGAAVAARRWRRTGCRAGPAPRTRRPRLTRTARITHVGVVAGAAPPPCAAGTAHERPRSSVGGRWRRHWPPAGRRSRRRGHGRACGVR